MSISSLSGPSGCPSMLPPFMKFIVLVTWSDSPAPTCSQPIKKVCFCEIKNISRCACCALCYGFSSRLVKFCGCTSCAESSCTSSDTNVFVQLVHMDHLVGHTFCCQCHALLAFWSGHASSWTNAWCLFWTAKPKFLRLGSGINLSDALCEKSRLVFFNICFQRNLTIWHIDAWRLVLSRARVASGTAMHALKARRLNHAILQHTLIS